MCRIVSALLFSILMAGLVACGGGTRLSSTTPSTPSQSAGFSISPDSAILLGGASASFTANRPASWRVEEGAAGGSITASGATAVYTAGRNGGVYHVIGTELDDSSLTVRVSVAVAPAQLRPSGSLATARLAHTATLLPNGKILVAGGGYGPDMIDGFFVVNTAELLDPTSGTTTPAGSITRDLHTATLLPDGTVLLAGGEIGWAGNFPVLADDAEIYDPATGTSSPAGKMVAQREDHVATLLPDGRVLITGGFAWTGGISPTALASAEIYDPATRTFASAGNMTTSRGFHTATLLRTGKVLIVGGDNAYNSNGQLASGGSAELFDPRTGTFTRTGSLPVAPTIHSATLLADGRVLIAGGGTNSAEIYDPATGQFTVTGSMLATRSFHTATLLSSGKVLVAGGIDWRSGDIGLVEMYDPASGLFTLTALMSQGRLWHTATTLADGTVLFIGGASSDDGIHISTVQSIEKY